MARRILGLVGACLLGGLSMAVAQEAQWIDLTHDLSEDAVFWPTANRFSMTTDFEGMTEKGYYYSAYSFTTAEHGARTSMRRSTLPRVARRSTRYPCPA